MFHHPRSYRHVHLLRRRGDRTLRRVIMGGALILLGVAYMLKNQGLISGAELWLVAPAAIALSGLARLIALPSLASAGNAALQLAVAAYLVVVIEHIGGWTFGATWPVLLIAAGVAHVGHALFGRRLCQEPNW